MVWTKIDAYRSPDRRLRTESYKSGDEKCFSIAEATVSGTLVTELMTSGEVIDQVYSDTKDTTKALSDYLGSKAELKVIETDEYEHVVVKVSCTKCRSDGSIERALDQQKSGTISEVPVVPIFLCKKCGSKFYSMSDSYLRRLVARKESLFKVDEAAEKKLDEGKFVGTLQEYIIRIFASKKIHRLKIES